MNSTLLGYFLLIASAFLLYFPVFVLGNNETMNLNELIRMHPQFAWLKHGYQFTLALIVLPLAVLTIYIFMNQEIFKEQYFLLLIPFVSTFSLFHGILAFMTGLYPLWVTKSIICYCYDKEKKKTWVSEVQIGLALAMMLTSLLIYFKS